MNNLPINQIGNYMGDQLEKLLRVTVLETDSRLKQQSPVDTGRFRFSWQIGENAAGSTPAPEGSYGTAITPPKGDNYQAGQEKLGNYYSVHNNLPYAEPLAGGSYPPSWGGQYRSKQASPGWVDRTAREMQRFVDQNWERIKRQG
jgi:hypothetical protein